MTPPKATGEIQVCRDGRTVQAHGNCGHQLQTSVNNYSSLEQSYNVAIYDDTAVVGSTYTNNDRGLVYSWSYRANYFGFNARNLW
mmetsp:Transcript_3905/g.8608  ORF Transcript_3905/g.8608 Transcript_3905/m.8608 type:complete len:85 (+) Transcript_3905:124-378(+)